MKARRAVFLNATIESRVLEPFRRDVDGSVSGKGVDFFSPDLPYGTTNDDPFIGQLTYLSYHLLLLKDRLHLLPQWLDTSEYYTSILLHPQDV